MERWANVSAFLIRLLCLYTGVGLLEPSLNFVHRKGTWGDQWAIDNYDLPKFLKIHTAIFIIVKHPHHHRHRLGIKLREVSIEQRFAQISLRKLPGAILVDGLEERK